MTSGIVAAGGPGARPWIAARSRDRRFWLVAGGIVVLVLGAMLGVAFGSVSIAPGDTIAIVADRLLGTHLSSADAATQAIVWDLRLPRVLLAMTVGAGLAVAGATFQGLLRNPLADPYVLGTASGAALGAAIGLLLPIHFLVFGYG
ncbi:MAG TPA: iron chelate uptake ABC transporter family permease subunit, partial [Candidatus Limnocylindrales bacterium]